ALSEIVLPKNLQAEAPAVEDVKAPEIVEAPEVMEAAPALKIALEQVVEEERVAAESEKLAAVEQVKPAATPEAAQVEPVATKKEESKPVEAKKEAEKAAANPQPQKEVAKDVAPVQTEKPRPQVTAATPNSDAKAKAKAVTVKAPKITISDKRLKPSSTSDPQRLARLLVSEIKLYNEKKVSEGLENNNLYDLLKKPIDQSFEHYRTTVGDQADQSVNYFREELVNTLCNGDPT